MDDLVKAAFFVAQVDDLVKAASPWQPNVDDLVPAAFSAVQVDDFDKGDPPLNALVRAENRE